MQYVIVQNKQMILLGPIDWKQRFIQSEFDELYDNGEISFKYKVMPVAEGYIDVGEGFEIFPITDKQEPSYDPTYQHLAGPLWNFNDNKASMRYDVLETDIDVVKNNLKSVAAAERYNKEKSSVTIKVKEVDMSFSTSRENRNQFNTILATIGDGVINYKYINTFYELQLSDFQSIVSAINNYVQQQFDWEMSIFQQIDTATTIEQLKTIEIVSTQSV